MIQLALDLIAHNTPFVKSLNPGVLDLQEEGEHLVPAPAVVPQPRPIVVVGGVTWECFE